MIEAGAKGSREAWRQMVRQNVYPNGVDRFWYTAKGERTCPKCSAMPGLNKNGRGLDEPFMNEEGNPVDGPPLHPGCRCVVFVKPRRP